VRVGHVVHEADHVARQLVHGQVVLGRQHVDLVQLQVSPTSVQPRALATQRRTTHQKVARFVVEAQRRDGVG